MLDFACLIRAYIRIFAFRWIVQLVQSPAVRVSFDPIAIAIWPSDVQDPSLERANPCRARENAISPAPSSPAVVDVGRWNISSSPTRDPSRRSRARRISSPSRCGIRRDGQGRRLPTAWVLRFPCRCSASSQGIQALIESGESDIILTPAPSPMSRIFEVKRRTGIDRGDSLEGSSLPASQGLIAQSSRLEMSASKLPSLNQTDSDASARTTETSGEYTTMVRAPKVPGEG